MKKSIKERDFLKAIGIADEDNETKEKNLMQKFTDAVSDYFRRNKNDGKTSENQNGANVAETDGEAKTKLKNELDDLNTKYANNKKHTFGGVTIDDYEPKEYDGKTDEQIRNEAAGKYRSDYNGKKNELMQKSEASVRKKTAELNDADEENAEKKAELDSAYFNDYETAKNSAVKRGLGRSSILEGVLDNLGESLENDKAEADENTETKKRKIKNEIADVKNELYVKIKNLDDDIADKVNDEIERLTEIRNKEKAKVDSYNEAQKKKRDEKIKAAEANGVKYDEKLTKEYAEYYGDKFNAIYSYYVGLGKKAREEAVKDKDFIVQNLDEAGYKNLLNYLK